MELEKIKKIALYIPMIIIGIIAIKTGSSGNSLSPVMSVIVGLVILLNASAYLLLTGGK